MSSPATPLSNLTQAKLNITTILADITANPLPSYSVNGQSVTWSEYHSMLVEQLDKINKLIQLEGGPFEFQTQGVS